jgi:hypothetical protein
MEPDKDRWKWRKRLVAAVSGVGLGMMTLGGTLPLLVSWESATPMPYSWPAHHSLYLHTDGRTAHCSVDDHVTEPFTVSIPEAATSVRVAGRHVAALDSGPATVTCDASVTAVLDPDLRYAIAGSASAGTLATVGAAITIVTVYFLWGMRVARVG